MKKLLVVVVLVIASFYMIGCSSGFKMSSGDVSLAEIEAGQRLVSKNISVYEKKIEDLLDANIDLKFYNNDRQVAINDSLIAVYQNKILVLEQEADNQVSRLASRDKVLRWDVSSHDIKYAAELFVLTQYANNTGDNQASKELKGLIVNYLNYSVIATVTGPGGFTKEFTVNQKSSVTMDMSTYGTYSVLFRSVSNQKEGVISKTVGPNKDYYDANGYRYDLIAYALRFN